MIKFQTARLARRDREATIQVLTVIFKLKRLKPTRSALAEYDITNIFISVLKGLYIDIQLNYFGVIYP